MLRHPRRLVVIVAAVVIVGTGCSSGSDTESPSSAQPTTSTTSQTPTAAPGEVAVSTDGVTTAVGAPAESTEEEYFKACQAARTWMTEQGGDPKSQIEPFLKSLQSGDATAGPATFGTPWSQLPPGRQAAVIVAVQAAADALCG
jgi:hypothetical protein